MSGGHFEYKQSCMEDIATEIERLIKTNDDKSLNYWGEKVGKNYPPEIIEKFKEAVAIIRKAAQMTRRIDWLVSGDDGQETFLEQWKEEVCGVVDNSKRLNTHQLE